MTSKHDVCVVLRETIIWPHTRHIINVKLIIMETLFVFLNVQCCKSHYV